MDKAIMNTLYDLAEATAKKFDESLSPMETVENYLIELAKSKDIDINRTITVRVGNEDKEKPNPNFTVARSFLSEIAKSQDITLGAPRGRDPTWANLDGFLATYGLKASSVSIPTPLDGQTLGHIGSYSVKFSVVQKPPKKAKTPTD